MRERGPALYSDQPTGLMRRSRLLSLFLGTLALCFVCDCWKLRDTELPLSELVWARETSGLFLGSPSIIALADQTYLASHDEFGRGGVTRRVHVFRSRDRGENWEEIAIVQNQYWSSLFLGPRGSVFLLGTTADGNAGIAISRSLDDGITWSQQVLFPRPSAGTFATGVTPVLVANGRVWRAVELWAAPYQWPQNFQSIVISANVDADLMSPTSWSSSVALPFDRSWISNTSVSADIAGFLEGNAVLSPDGSVKVLLRMPLINTKPAFNINLNNACLLDVSGASEMVSDRFGLTDASSALLPADIPNTAMGNTNAVIPALSFNRIVSMPGGGNKFVVRKDNITGLYLALSNPQTDAAARLDQRNVLELIVSTDLVSWRRIATILSDDSGLTWPDSLRYTGFHYVDFQLGKGDESDDLIAVIRTSYRGAVSFHDSNRVTFTRVRAWRQLVTSAALTKTNRTGTPPINLIRPGRPGVTDRTAAPPIAQSAADACNACQGAACSATVCRLADKAQISAREAELAKGELSAVSGSFYWGSSCCTLGGKCGRCIENASSATMANEDGGLGSEAS